LRLYGKFSKASAQIMKEYVPHSSETIEMIKKDLMICNENILKDNITNKDDYLKLAMHIYKEKDYHKKKTQFFLERGIDIYHVWEDDWVYRKPIIKGLILNKLGIYEKRIGARKCEIKLIEDNKVVKDFLDNNHIQGSINSSVKIGLYYNNELVSLMTFGKLRNSLGFKNKSGYELLRFCNKIGFQIIGGASKLFSFFSKNYEYDEIISYADYSRSNGDVYHKMGFVEIGLTTPNYWYIIGDQRRHRFSFRKDVLVENGHDSNDIFAKYSSLAPARCGQLCSGWFGQCHLFPLLVVVRTVVLRLFQYLYDSFLFPCVLIRKHWQTSIFII
jgi:hypothetical protein